MNVRQLQKDYLEMIGEEIPYKKMGYSHIDQYLKSIPDVVTVHGRGPTATLEVVVTKKSAHINKLISKQKVTIKNKRRFYYLFLLTLTSINYSEITVKISFRCYKL